MQLATGSDLTTSRLGQPHEGVIGAKVSKRVAYCSAAQDLLSGTEIFFGGALRVLTRFSRKSHPRRIGGGGGGGPTGPAGRMFVLGPGSSLFTSLMY